MPHRFASKKQKYRRRRYFFFPLRNIVKYKWHVVLHPQFSHVDTKRIKTNYYKLSFHFHTARLT
ncbi:Uncharacterized protein APZ42_010908 [Daphnia magna]|uniref:Uncharacterized protein n=1 Tax=Daphnia magna TaxID=35525 RepID=A0A162D0I7_9CRUS|nr:Uncharacterized protein APZ42_010908 [Daphnia magna]